ncbi:MAG TPA: hypothetical protein VGS22_15225 [Thermoanaerobaculia bacterium]|jgi:hypothetical protein|nr:hypothetical protein [Thermoanaerobaculia bacterium]
MNESESLAERIRDWEKLLNTSKPLLVELPQFEETHTQLTEVVEDVKAHADREQTLRGQKAMSVARRKVLEDAARAIKAKLVAGLRGHFGTQDERLLEFGIPIGKVGRRVKATQAAEVLTPPETTPDVPVAAPAAAGS